MAARPSKGRHVAHAPRLLRSRRSSFSSIVFLVDRLSRRSSFSSIVFLVDLRSSIFDLRSSIFDHRSRSPLPAAASHVANLEAAPPLNNAARFAHRSRIPHRPSQLLLRTRPLSRLPSDQRDPVVPYPEMLLGKADADVSLFTPKERQVLRLAG
jgi:hypothetical protein